MTTEATKQSYDEAVSFIPKDLGIVPADAKVGDRFQMRGETWVVKRVEADRFRAVTEATYLRSVTSWGKGNA